MLQHGILYLLSVVNELFCHCYFLYPKLLMTQLRESLPASLAQEDHHFSHSSPNAVSSIGSVVFTHIHTPTHTIFQWGHHYHREYLPVRPVVWYTYYVYNKYSSFQPLTIRYFTHFTVKELRRYETGKLAPDRLARSETHVFWLKAISFYYYNMLLPSRFPY